MKISKPLHNLLSIFNANWKQNQSRLCLEITENKIRNIEIHPLKGELINLINEVGGSLPFFAQEKITWCTIAPTASLLQTVVQQLQAWVLPSYGWLDDNDGYETPNPNESAFQNALFGVSPTNYFRWRSSINNYSTIERKLATRHQLEITRPERVRNRPRGRR